LRQTHGSERFHRLCASHVVSRDLVDVQRARLPHDRDELVIQDREHAVHAGLADGLLASSAARLAIAEV
jgi:hypothetical protein